MRSYSNGTFTATGAGADIWGTADAFHYVYESLSGDGQIIARVVGLTNTNAYAKAGVMFRESLSAGASHVMLDLEPTGGVEFMQRSATGAAATSIASATDAQPIWLKLVRSASSFSAFASPDGVTWSPIGTTTVVMAATIDVGFVVCSHDATTLNTATFDHVSVTANAPTPPSTPASPSPTDGAAGVSASATLTWAAPGATSYDVKFGTSNPPPTVSTSQSAATFAASSLLAGTKYFWQIVAHNASGTTSGPVWSFTTATAAPGGLPSPWQSHDVGNVGALGSASFSSGTFTVKGGGADIWGTVDAFQYAELPLSGDVQFIARVTSLTEYEHVRESRHHDARVARPERAAGDPGRPAERRRRVHDALRAKWVDDGCGERHADGADVAEARAIRFHRNRLRIARRRDVVAGRLHDHFRRSQSDDRARRDEPRCHRRGDGDVRLRVDDIGRNASGTAAAIERRCRALRKRRDVVDDSRRMEDGIKLHVAKFDHVDDAQQWRVQR